MQRQWPHYFLFVGFIASSLTPQCVYAEQQASENLTSDQIKKLLDEQTQNLTAEKKRIAEQEAELAKTRRNLDAAQRQLNQLKMQTGLAPEPPPPAIQQQNAQQAQPSRPVGQAADSRPPEIAQIFQQPGVLTPQGKFVLDPSLQYAYSTSNRVALVGYTVIPALLIGLIDINEVKNTTATAAITTRYGLTNRFEIEAKIPYVYRSNDSVANAFGTSTPTSTVYNTDGHGIGDIEFTARYQFNDGGADSPYYIGNLRVKTRTGIDPFDAKVSTTIAGLGSSAQTELPTGSGFYGVQPGLTVLIPSDPAVFFGGVSYLYNIKRNHVVQKTTDAGDLDLGSVQPGGIFEFNLGMGLALNERASFSIGYDQSSVGKTKQNGRVVADSVTVQLATLLLGFSYRLDDQRSLNFTLGAGLTTDTPDITLTMRMPWTF